MVRAAPFVPFALAILCGLAPAQVGRPARNVQRPALPFQLDPAVHQKDSVIVKFVEGVPVRLEAGRFVTTAAIVADLTPYNDLLLGLDVTRLFTRSVQDLDQERGALLARTPADRPLPADLNNYYRVRTGGLAQSEQLVNQLNTMALIETAYPEPSRDALVMIGDIPPNTALFDGEEDYKAAAPAGHGYSPFACVVGARCPDIQVGHLEGSWYWDHEDGVQITQASVVTTLPTPSWDGWRDHGNAVAGLLTADRNEYGTRGMASDATLLLGSLEAGAANMISQCTAVSGPGDVWVSSFAWVTSTGAHAPVDWLQAEFDAVNTAAVKGIVYCFGAGNSDEDLGDTSIYGNRYVPGQPDSGGVIVGARNSDNENKISFSNYGARVDCSAWGEDIATLGYGDLFYPGGDDQQSYTRQFGGTSGAGPIVAGIAAALSSIVLEQNGVQLDAFQVRDLLRNFGTPQGTGGPVGRKADLAALLAQHSLPDGLNLSGDGFSNDGVLGQPVTLHASGGMPSSPFLVLASPARAHIPSGLNRDFLVDLSGALILKGLRYDATGLKDLTSNLPNDNVLVGTSTFLQVLDFVGGSLHLTNSVELFVRE